MKSSPLTMLLMLLNLLSLFTLTLGGPLVTTLLDTSLEPRDTPAGSLDTIATQGMCHTLPLKSKCLLSTLTRPNGFVSLYWFRNDCRLAGYAPRIAIDSEYQFNGEYPWAVIVTVQDHGWNPRFKYAGSKYGNGSKKDCHKDENGMINCQMWFWCDPDAK